MSEVALTADPVPRPDHERRRRFEQAVVEHHARIYRFVLKYVGQPEDARDLTQQAFLEAYRSLDSYGGHSSMFTWLCGVALNIVRNYRSRAPQNRYTFVSDEELEHLPSEAETPEAGTGRRQELKVLRDAVDGLSPDLREAFVLAVLEDVPYQDVADMLGIPIGTVRSRVSRARAALRRAIDRTSVS